MKRKYLWVVALALDMVLQLLAALPLVLHASLDEQGAGKSAAGQSTVLFRLRACGLNRDWTSLNPLRRIYQALSAAAFAELCYS